jgi:hypothetical protein
VNNSKTQEWTMNIVSVPVAILRLQYRIARVPLQLIEDRVMTRFDAETPARLFYERSLGSLDAAVGSALGDVNLQTRGSALVERSDALSRAARLDATATAKREKADAAKEAKLSEASQEQQDAREARAQEVEEAQRSAQKRATRAAETAQQRTAAAKKEADEAASRQASAVEAARKAEREAIRDDEQAVVAATQARLDDAAAKRAEASTKRAKADRVEQLAETEKVKRQADRANS